MSEVEAPIIIVGGGPAGACAANLLAQAGHRAVVLEGEFFPRFHIGESLLPMELPVIARLGVDLDERPYLRKRGALFIDERNGRTRQASFSFAEGLPGTPPHAHNVERAKFDQDLLHAAARAGAEVREGHRVDRVEIGADEVVVSGRARAREGGEERSFELCGRYLVDATGQRALLARAQRSLEPYRNLGRAAAFRHYNQLAPEAVAELQEHGDVIIKIVDGGWMWGIPMICGTFSVGLVKATGKVEAEMLEHEVAVSPLLSRLTAGAEATAIELVGNFSYRNLRPHGARFACIGDAACFLDPIFSSGVTLALIGAERFADLLAPALAEGREADPQLMAPLSAHMDRAYEAFERFIHRFYHTRLADNVLLAEGHTSHGFRSGVISVLGLDVWRDDNPFLNMLMRARRV